LGKGGGKVYLKGREKNGAVRKKSVGLARTARERILVGPYALVRY